MEMAFYFLFLTEIRNGVTFMTLFMCVISAPTPTIRAITLSAVVKDILLFLGCKINDVPRMITRINNKYGRRS